MKKARLFSSKRRNLWKLWLNLNSCLRNLKNESLFFVEQLLCFKERHSFIVIYVQIKCYSDHRVVDCNKTITSFENRSLCHLSNDKEVRKKYFSFRSTTL
jgi:hypothetical protein